MTAPPLPQAGRWGDLRLRVLSAIVLIGFAAIEIYLGGPAFDLAVALVVGVMVWEIAVMTASRAAAPLALGLAVLAGAVILAWAFLLPGGLAHLVLALPALALLVTPRGDRRVLAAYGLAVTLAGAGFITLRAEGAGLFLWLVLVVVASDTLGYFAGRLIGGPKFWPAVSPKKTWSGTVAGWVGALVVGLGFALAGWPWHLVWLAPLVALAGQMGDIAESAIKRRAGIKDSSRLIPGHGGVLDRFDALIGAVLALMVLRLVLPGAF